MKKKNKNDYFSGINNISKEKVIEAPLKLMKLLCKFDEKTNLMAEKIISLFMNIMSLL